MEKRCFACMNKLETHHCQRCGHDNNNFDEVSKHQLKPGTMLKERFHIGLVIEQNGEGFTYMAYDITEKKRTRIREFFPDNLCYRKKDGLIVCVSGGYEIQYKSLMSEFAELSKQIIDLKSNNSLVKANMIFAENDTLYTVYEDVVGTTLKKYLMDNAGDLSWDETENLFLPLLYTVKILNSAGVIHRGISPETIIVTKQNELKLTGLCTSSVRAINSEVRSELYAGYAAPEQYQKCTSHGEWTDVYSLCAVLYKTLTGSMPPRADIRGANETLVTPRQLNSAIPQSVSDAIVNGLAYHKEDRTSFVKDLIGSLYSSPQQTVDAQQYESKKKKKKKKLKLPIWLTVILITLPVIFIAFFVLYYMVLGPRPNANKNPSSNGISSKVESEDISSDEVSSDQASSVVTNNVVVDFKGLFYDDVIRSSTYTKMFTFKKIEEFSETIERGVIIKQSIEPNTIKPEGTEIELTVSNGLRYVVLAPLIDNNGMPISLEDYQRDLTDLGFEYEVEKVDSDILASGQIVRLSHPTNSTIDREEVKKITIFVAN